MMARAREKERVKVTEKVKAKEKAKPVAAERLKVRERVHRQPVRLPRRRASMVLNVGNCGNG